MLGKGCVKDQALTLLTPRVKPWVIQIRTFHSIDGPLKHWKAVLSSTLLSMMLALLLFFYFPWFAIVSSLDVVMLGVKRLMDIDQGMVYSCPACVNCSKFTVLHLGLLCLFTGINLLNLKGRKTNCYKRASARNAAQFG